MNFEIVPHYYDQSLNFFSLFSAYPEDFCSIKHGLDYFRRCDYVLLSNDQLEKACNNEENFRRLYIQIASARVLKNVAKAFKYAACFCTGYYTGIKPATTAKSTTFSSIAEVSIFQLDLYLFRQRLRVDSKVL